VVVVVTLLLLVVVVVVTLLLVRVACGQRILPEHRGFLFCAQFLDAPLGVLELGLEHLRPVLPHFLGTMLEVVADIDLVKNLCRIAHGDKD